MFKDLTSIQWPLNKPQLIQFLFSNDNIDKTKPCLIIGLLLWLYSLYGYIVDIDLYSFQIIDEKGNQISDDASMLKMLNLHEGE